MLHVKHKTRSGIFGYKYLIICRHKKPRHHFFISDNKFRYHLCTSAHYAVNKNFSLHASLHVLSYAYSQFQHMFASLQTTYYVYPHKNIPRVCIPLKFSCSHLLS